MLGLVGAGGIGLPLNAAITTLAWTQVSLILLVIIAHGGGERMGVRQGAARDHLTARNSIADAASERCASTSTSATAPEAVSGLDVLQLVRVSMQNLAALKRCR